MPENAEKGIASSTDRHKHKKNETAQQQQKHDTHIQNILQMMWLRLHK